MKLEALCRRIRDLRSRYVLVLTGSVFVIPTEMSQLEDVDADIADCSNCEPRQFPNKQPEYSVTGAATPVSYQANGPGAEIARGSLFSSGLCLLVEKIGNGDQAGSFRLDCLAYFQAIDSVDSSKSLMHRVTCRPPSATDYNTIITSIDIEEQQWQQRGYTANKDLLTRHGVSGTVRSGNGKPRQSVRKKTGSNMVIMVWATAMLRGICLKTADDGDSLPIFVVSPSAPPLSPRPSVQAELQSAPSLLTVHAVSFKTSVGRL